VAAGVYGHAPDWSADGSHIAFAGLSHVYIMQADGTNPIPIIEGGNPAWRPVNTAFPPPPPPVNTPPVAAFTHQCSGLTCTLDGRSSTDDGGIVSYTWDLGVTPGGSASGATVTTTYAEAAPRTVTLTVTDGAGQTNSATRTIDVVAPPDQPPNATFTVSCLRTKCTFDGRASTDDRGIVSYDWDVGRPGGRLSGAVVTNDYRHSGSFTVTLTVKDAAGQSSFVWQTVTVVR
jgi:PKD repeat protein